MVHLLPRTHTTQGDSRRGLSIDMGRDDSHRGSARHCSAGEFEPLLATAVIADEPHGINRLTGTTCGDEDSDPGEVLCRCSTQGVLCCRHDGRGIRKSPGAGVGSGEPT